MKKIASIILISIVYNLNIFAITLEESLTKAYKDSDQFQAIQNIFLGEIEQFPQAIANFMPKVNAAVTKRNQKVKNNVTGASSRNHDLSKQISVNQPIFRGGAGVAALKAAQSSFRSSRGKYYSNEQKILLGIIQAYLRCYEAKEKYEIAQTSLNSNQKQLEAAEERLKVGEATTTERASALSAVATAEANRLTAYANEQAAKAAFFSIVGLEATDITLPELPLHLPQTLDEIVTKARIKNFDLEMARHDTITAKATETGVKGALLPQVDFNLTAGNNTGFPEDIIGAQRSNTNSITTAVSVNIPIYAQGGAEYSRIRQAKKQTKGNAIALDQKIKELNANCISNWEAFQAQKSGTDATTEAVNAAQIAYDGTVQEEFVGSKTILDVLDAQEKLNSAKRQKVESLVQYINSAYQVKALMGELTAKNLGLKVDYFNPETEFKKSKIKLIGF